MFVLKTGLLLASIVMASSPSSISGRRNRPGCMGGIAHLFDFNQALAGRKLLTDKKFGAGLEPLRNTFNDNEEQSKSKINIRGEIQFGKSASGSRRSIEVPMKALIAEEISQELARDTEPKNRAPSVVARLMGLDALPGDRKSEQSTQRGELENLVQKVSSDRLHRGKALVHSPSGSTKSATRSVSDLSSSRRSNWEEHAPSFESLSSHRHSHEQNSREVFEPWRNWKSEDHARMQALEDLDSQLAAKQLLIKKKLSEAKLGLLSKNSGPQEKLYESKEFMDAIDFLQANKDFFARFLEEPDSLFAKHLRNSEENSMPGNIEELAKHTKRRANGASDNGGKSQHWGKEPPDLKKSQYKSSERDFQVNEKLSGGGSVLQPFSVKSQLKHQKRFEYNESSPGESHQAPTRIVVLKPGPGKVRNLMSMSQNSPRSPREFFDAMEVIKENSMDVLQELKDKLQQEDARGESRNARHSVNEHSKPLRDPREIAREIARQVRENVTRDLRAHSKSTTSEISTGRKTQLSKMAHQSSSMNGSNKGSELVSGRDCGDASFGRDYGDGSFGRQNAVFDRNGFKEESRRSLDQLRVERFDGWLPEAQNAASGRSWRRDRSQPPHAQGNLGTDFVDDITSSQKNSMLATYEDIDADSCTYSVCESETNGYARSEGRIDNAMCITLLRSRSVPTSSSSLDKIQDEFRREDQGMLGNNIFAAGMPKTVETNRSSDATLRQTDPLRRSIFSRKGSGLKGNFSKSKMKIKQVDELPLPSQVLPTEKSIEVTSYENEKAQHQIDDTGPILDSDSSVSSLDNSLTLEVANVAEGLDETKIPAGSPTSGSIEASKSEETKVELNCPFVHIEEGSEISLQSPLESPSKSTSLTDGEPMMADPEANKNPSEQLSPVSVLDAPFPEEPASPMDFTEISSGLQELRVRLQLLKFVDQDSVSIQEDYQEEDVDLTYDNQCATIHLHSSPPGLEMAGLDCSSVEMENPYSLTNGVVCPQGKELELMYVRDLLVASGFTIDSATVLTRWHAPSQPLGRYVFETVEDSYKDGKSRNAACKEEGGGLDSHARHLLFDSVNEVLLEVLGPQVNCRTWWKSSHKSTTLGMLCGKDLVGQIWAGVCKLFCSQSEVQDTLGSLVARDLATKDRWQDFTCNIEIVVLEVERAIFTDLLQEILIMY